MNAILQHHEAPEENDGFLEAIFSHEKCQHFSENDRSKIREAYGFARKIHRNDTRKSKRPYIEHIEETTDEYLRIIQKEKVTPEDIMVAILHDTIEDHPECSQDLQEKFGFSVFLRVMNLSKPSSSVLEEKYSIIAKSILNNLHLFPLWWMYAA